MIRTRWMLMSAAVMLGGVLCATVVGADETPRDAAQPKGTVEPNKAPESKGPTETGNPDESDPGPASGTVPLEAQDAGFDKFVDMLTLSQALADQDPVLTLDIALQLVEGERILLRPHKVIKSATLLELALRFAIAKKDKATFARISKAAGLLKMTELETVIKTQEPRLSATRAPAPKVDLGTLTPEDVISYNAYQKQIVLAMSIGDKEDLQALKNGLEETDIGAELKKQIAKDLDTAIRDVPALGSPEEVAAFRALSAVARDSNKGNAQASVRNGWLSVAWGKEIDAIEYVKLTAAMASGTIGVYLADLLRDSIATLGRAVVIQAIKSSGRTFGSGRFVCQAGIATYNNWKYISALGIKKKIPLPNTHQPYLRWKRT